MKEFPRAVAVVTLAQEDEVVMRVAKAMCHGFSFLFATLEMEGIRKV